ncbi:Tartrate-resistant acid phosphatase type 5, partial [Globisporangium splendens]
MKLCAVVPLAWALACPQVWAAATTDVLTSVICASTEAAAYLGFHCSTSASSSSPSPTSTSSPSPPTTTRSTSTTETPTATTTPSPTVDKTATYSLHALAIGVRGVDLGLDSCCNRYRSTGVDNAEYYKDQQAQQNVAHLLSFSAKKLKPKVIIGHGDNFYWNGLGSDDVAYRFQNSFEAYYNQDSLIDVKWVNVAGNHDYGGAMFICGRWDNQIVECTSKADLLKQLDEKFTHTRSVYVETIKDADTGVTVDIFNVDTNAVTVHGEEQICCHCYGYETKYGGDASCNNVDRGHPLCVGGHTNMVDACLAKLEEWQADSLRQLFRDAKASTATWKVVNSHYSPHSHVAPPMMQEWNNVLAATGVHLFMNGHTHTESHEYGDFKTHFVTNGTSGGTQSGSIGGPPDYATNINTVWIGHDTPYGIFELYFGKQQMKLQFITFDDAWQFKESSADTVKGGGQVGHCWLIPKDGSKGEEC